MKFRAALTRPVHVSWFVAWAAVGVLLGAALAGVLHVRSFAVAWIIISAVVLFAALFRRWKIFVVFALAFGLCLGLWRGAFEQKSLQLYQPFYGKTVVLSGTVSEDTSYGPHGDQRIMLKTVSIGGQKLPGKVWISLVSRGDIQRSDHVSILGKLSAGFGNLPASMFFARTVKIERPQPGDVALHVRDWFASAVKKAIPEPESDLGVGYLVGQRSALPDNIDNDFKTVSLTHAVVASGYNLTILVVFARRIFLKKSKYLSLLTAAAMAFGFMLITGFSPSMTRAGIVVALGLGAWYYGRKVHPLVLLPLAAAVTILLDPAYIWGDIGWALSFAAFAGVLVLAPLLHRYFWGKARPSALRDILVSTVAAQAATMPIMMFAFGQYSPYALIANLLVLPLVPLTMLLTFVAGVGALVLPGLAHIFGWPASIILHYMIVAVDKIATLPNAQSSLKFGAASLALSYIIISVAVLILWHKTRLNFRQAEFEKLADKLTT